MLNSELVWTMLGKDAILHYFETKCIRNVFHLPGIHSLPLNESFTSKNIRIINGRHESSLSFMADGYARASGEAGVLIVTPGPGLGNVVSGCMEAHSDDVPLLVVHIDTGREKIGKGILHEVEEPESMFARFTKRTFVVSRKDDLVPFLDRAYHTAVTERRGPVVISIPYRFLEKHVPFVPDGDLPGHEEHLDPGSLKETLSGVARPVIIGGKSLMREELRLVLDGICEEMGIPFLTTTAGKGVLSEDRAWAFGNVMQKGVARDILNRADVVIALGTRLREVDAKARGVKIRNLVHLDTDDRWISRNYPAKVALAGDMAALLPKLGGVLKGGRFEWGLQELKEAEKREREALEKKYPGFRIIKLIRESIPEETTTVWDSNLIAYWAEYYFPVIHQRSFIMPRGISPIFYGFPAAIGAKLGRPDRPCLSVSGDGGFLSTAGELATIKRYGIPVVVLVYNNNSYGVLEDYMDSSYGIKGSMALTNPDFVKLARSFGIKAKRARTLGRLEAILRRDVTWDEPFLIEFDFPVLKPPWK